MKLNSLQLFIHVVDQQGITQAADFLSMPKSSVSRKIKELEEKYNIIFINRSARYFSLTKAGDAFYQHCTKITEQFSLLEQDMAAHQQGVSGKISILCLSPLLKCLGKLLQDFCQQYPDVELEFHAQDVVERNIPKRQFDLMIQVNEPVISNLIGKNIGKICADYYASPDYLSQHGVPTTPEALTKHRLIFREMSQDQPRQWTFQAPRRTLNLANAHVTSVDSSDIALTLTKQGFGISLIPDIQVKEALENKELMLLFGGSHRHSFPVNLIYHDRQQIPRKVRLLIDHLAEHFESAIAQYQLPNAVDAISP